MVGKHVILDASLGRDSYFTAMLALRSEYLHLDAITVSDPLRDRTVHGMFHLLLHSYMEVPVCRGALCGLTEDPAQAMDPSAGRFPEDPVSQFSAVEMMHRSAQAYPDELVLLTHSPLTSVADFLLTYPEDREKIHSIVVLENRTSDRYAWGFDFQPDVDPEAANVIFHSGVPVFFVPLSALSVTEENRPILDRVCLSMDTVIGRFLNHSPNKQADLPTLCGLADILITTFPQGAATENRQVFAVTQGSDRGTFVIGETDLQSSVRVVTHLDYSLCLTPGFGLVDTPELIAFEALHAGEENHHHDH